MYEKPIIELVILSEDDILTSSPGNSDIWDDGKGDNATEDDEL